MEIPPLRQRAARAFRVLLGLWTPEDWPGTHLESPPKQSVSEPEPFHGYSVPEDATRDPSDSKLYDEFFERILVAPAREADTLVVFAAHLSDNADEGEYMTRSDEEDAEEVEHRLECARRVYARIFAEVDAHPRIVAFRGPTPTGYKLERLALGPLTEVNGLQPARAGDCWLKLFQRWALQVLTALRFLHDKGIILNVVSDHAFWLRDDLSIAVANMVVAGCAELGVSAGPYHSSSIMNNPWQASDVFKREDEDEDPFTEADTGSPKRDLFDWATWVYTLMTGSGPLITGFEHLDMPTQAGIIRAREEEIARREFEDWPQMEERMLGSVVVRAWKGRYASAAQVLEEARELLEAHGTSLSAEVVDELTGFDWREAFAVGSIEKNGNQEPIIRRRKE